MLNKIYHNCLQKVRAGLSAHYCADFQGDGGHENLVDQAIKKPSSLTAFLFEFGSACWARTSDPMINSLVQAVTSLIGILRNTLKHSLLQRIIGV